MKSRSEIEHDLVLAVSSKLKQSIKECGYASLLVSGGSTPIHFFQQLAAIKLDWSKVTVLPVDERFLPDSHKDQNGNLIKNNLIQKEAAQSNWFPVVLDSADSEKNLSAVREKVKGINQPFTVTILGMGTDGHTASLFPCSKELETGMAEEGEDIIITNPTSAPYQRISFTKKAILNSKFLFLHCYGEEKKQILDSLDSHSEKEYPIKAFINQKTTKIEIFWTK